jgi:endonuclease/exonuclease/phosphatase family metal-dependent hydrolase
MSRAAASDEHLAMRVLTLNLWGGGLHAGRCVADTIAALRSVEADLITLQEVWLPNRKGAADTASMERARGLAQELATALGLHCYEQRGPAVRGVMVILSRHHVTRQTDSGLGVTIDVAGRSVAVFNLHLPDAPYQPYQLAGIDYDGAPWLDNAEDAIASAAAARGSVVDIVEREIDDLGGTAAIVAGDFNEPSHLDWTPHAVAAGLHPLAVAWPATRRFQELGFSDLYRAAHPDEVTRPGATWTALDVTDDKHDRIDFIFARGAGLSLHDACVVGEPGPVSDIAVAPWPSDHRGVVATLAFGATARRA